MTSSLRTLTLCLLTGCFMMAASDSINADILELDDGNLIECKVLRIEKSSQGDTLIVIDEQGNELSYDKRRVKSLIRTRKTSWEVKAERKEWYQKQSAKLGDESNWRDQAKFAKKCAKKELPEEATSHYLLAYKLRKPEATTEKQIAQLANWCEDCELFDAATEQRRRIYELRKAKLDGSAKDHVFLAKWCDRNELLVESAEQYRASLELEASKKAQKELDNVERQLAIPMDNGFFKATKKRIEKAADFLRKKQARDGSIGSDISEAGVHGIRAMTSIAAMALIAEWDFGVRAGRLEADQVPEEVNNAIDFLLGFEPTNGNLAGDDVWGPIFAIDLLLECYERAAFESRKKEFEEEINRLIKNLAELQRHDGGWNYYNFIDYSAGFVSAAGIMSLVRAANNDFEFERSMIERAVGHVKSMRQGEGTFTYSTGLPQGPVGACARSPLCELALAAAGVGKERNLRYAIEIFFNNRHILEGLKGSAGTHIGEGKTAPYYLLFAHYWTSRAIKYIDRNAQRKYLNGLGGGLVAYQEGDATFGDWTGTRDYKVYGTALASLTMYNIASLRDEIGELKPEEEKEEKKEGTEKEEEPDPTENPPPDPTKGGAPEPEGGDSDGGNIGDGEQGGGAPEEVPPPSGNTHPLTPSFCQPLPATS